MAYPYRYELFKRVDESPGKEKYVLLSTFPSRPTGDEINDAFEGKTRYHMHTKIYIWENPLLYLSHSIRLLAEIKLKRLQDSGKIPLYFNIIIDFLNQNAWLFTTNKLPF